VGESLGFWTHPLWVWTAIKFVEFMKPYNYTPTKTGSYKCGSLFFNMDLILKPATDLVAGLLLV
jgi:hypothetical protein